MNPTDIFSIFNPYLRVIFTQKITNDSKARASFRSNLSNLKNCLEELALQIINPPRRPSDDLKKIKNFKNIIQKIEVDCAEFLFKIPGLRNDIDNSEALIERIKIDPDNPANRPFIIAIDLLQLWGNGFGRYYKSTEINNLRSLIDLGFIKRMWYAMLPVDRLVICSVIKQCFIIFPLLILLK